MFVYKRTMQPSFIQLSQRLNRIGRLKRNASSARRILPLEEGTYQDIPKTLLLANFETFGPILWTPASVHHNPLYAVITIHRHFHCFFRLRCPCAFRMVLSPLIVG